MWGRFLRVVTVILLAAVAIVALISLELSDTASRHQITNPNPQKQSDHAPDKQDWTAQIAIATDWLDRHREWVNIIFTGFVAIFTGTLWGATSRLAYFAQTQASDMQGLLRVARENAAAAASQAEAMKQLHGAVSAQGSATRDQANATAKIAEASLDQLRVLIATESPVFFWGDFKLEQLSGDAVSGLSPNVYYRPGAIIKNIGRSPLELRAFCIEPLRGGFRTDFGPSPKYNRIISLEFLVEAGGEVPLYSDHLISFYENEAQEFNRGDRMFYLYGFVRYYNQFTDETWEAGRIGRWRPSIGFVPIGIPGYVYHRRQTAENGNRNPML